MLLLLSALRSEGVCNRAMGARDSGSVPVIIRIEGTPQDPLRDEPDNEGFDGDVDMALGSGSGIGNSASFGA